jgi:Rap1a immunity proteins
LELQKMNFLKLFINSTSIFFLLSSTLHAQPVRYKPLEASELLAICTSPGSLASKMIQCHSYIDGVLEGSVDGWAYTVARLGMLNTKAELELSKTPPNCIDNLDRGYVYKTVIEAMRHRSLESETAAFVVGEEVRKNFPCN